MITITIRPDEPGEEPNQFRINMPETGYSYVGTVAKAEISGPSGLSARKQKTGNIAFTLTGKDAIVI